MKRRTFLKKTSLASLPVFLGGFKIAALPSGIIETLVNGESDKILVLIDLNGGNDGLNTFVPLDSYDNLANARPHVIVPENKLLTFTDTIGLHPEMTGIKNLHDDGNLTVVQGVGYPNQNRSHFRSADIWNTAASADEYIETGWLGRYLDDKFPGYPGQYPNEDFPDPFAITIGTTISPTCQGTHSSFSISLSDFEDIGGLTPGVDTTLPKDYYGDRMAFLIDSFKKSNAYGERVNEAADLGEVNGSLYPDSKLANQFKTVIQLISGGLRTRVYVLRLGGFDTHANQVDHSDTTKGKHAELLKTLSDAIYAFQNDLQFQGLDNRVLGMTFSEFGRKIISNAGVGTDHGSAAPMMVFGSCVNQKIIGDNPEIAAEVNHKEGVPMQYDFRSVYGSILMDWFEIEEDKIKALLTNDFQYIPIVGNCPISPYQDIPTIRATAFPNPFEQLFKLRIELQEEEEVQIDLSDVLGKIIQVITNKKFAAGKHRVFVEIHGLPAGTYFARIQAGSAVKTVRVVKKR